MQHGIQIDYSTLSPETKIQILREMGFKEIPPAEHGTNCLSRQGSGMICDCLMGVTTWGAPLDVKKWLGETHEARSEFAARRHAYLNDGEGESPGSWAVHLEKTAPRYRH
ncbi:hypothetical protein SEA_KELA_253 [Streptomyces phage Kela]|jgi:hypothetical protein|nr:hypothetical protein SEA_KELA_253 [Streptomyces phage Kela]